MRMIRLALGVAVLAAAACGSTEDELVADEDSLCAKQCVCSGFCSEDDLDECDDEDRDLKDQAQSKGCDGALDDYLGCVEDLECDNGAVDDSDCSPEWSGLSACMNPKPACPTAKNGTCDEPEGTGTCPEGSDPDDCGSPPPCETTSNGVCDEPEGTGLCPEGSDAVDCGSPPPCPSTNNGVCDEPEGSGLCPEGTDAADCPKPPCETTDNGICDEPEGTGSCPEGTDFTDCEGSCVKCADYITEGIGDLCPASQGLYDALVDCTCVTECSVECAASTCQSQPAEFECSQCIMALCSSQFNACANDL